MTLDPVHTFISLIFIAFIQGNRLYFGSLRYENAEKVIPELQRPLLRWKKGKQTCKLVIKRL